MQGQPTREPSLSILLNQFEDISGPEIYGPEGLAIMIALWRKSSKLNWLSAFTMTNTELQIQTGIHTRKTLNVYRKKLADDGLIDYSAPPLGKARGDYKIRFSLIDGPQLVTSGTDYLKIESQPVTSGNSFDEVGQKVVTSGTDSVPTVFDIKDLDLKIFSSDTDSEKNIDFEMNVREVETYFITKRNLGTEINNEDYKAIRQALVDGLPVQVIKGALDKAFAKHKPKHRMDKIRTFTYCAPICYDAWSKVQAITEPLEPVALGGSITENVPSEPVALGSKNTHRTKNQKQLDDLDKFIKENKRNGDNGSS